MWRPNSAPGQPLGTLGQALKLIPKPLPAGAKFTVIGGQDGAAADAGRG